ncbi:Wzz/FepE/Etk N-terminal domain-containing protein [Cognatiyoonia sp. IB215446]|uniref:polysaccharide biosynthesis tyrosine autokinase n=1 Tax=Cognatiyoonia sp. IB215446 TaxID=3097355 RepID=UPI002A1485C5|nr:Wzz/FepE/Etk N-terminal domain-containing protein [Cognatiyoonia sp. IB215446]MDX8347923.1 Wzz/FepE/Etk N-terminal domain-containing protein [Cognatiyoonia sp. IB215446]
MSYHTPPEPFAVTQSAVMETARIAPLDVLGLLACLWRGKWIVVLSVTIAVVLAGYYAFAISTPRYAATVTLQVAKPVETGSTSFDRPLSAEIAQLRSQSLLDRVIEELDLLDNPSFNRHLTPISAWSVSGIRATLRETLSGQAQAIPNAGTIQAKTRDNLQSIVSARADEESRVLSITAIAGSEQGAIIVANTVAEMYILDQVETTRAQTQNTITWLTDRVYAQQIDLARKEAEITDLISRAQVTDQLAFDALKREALDTDTRLREARATLATLRSAADSSAPALANASRVEGQIAALEAMRQTLSTQLTTQSEGLAQLQQLRREADAARVLYETFLARLQDASLQTGLQPPQSRILRAAGTADYVATRKTLLVGLAALLGAVLGITWVFLRDVLSTGFREPVALRNASGLPVIGQMPRLRLRNTAQLLDHLAASAGRGSQDAAAALRTAILASGTAEGSKTILCTSSTTGEGKTQLSLALAHSFGGLGKAVLLIDADAENGGVARYLTQSQSHPLQTVLNDQIPLAHAVQRDPRWHVETLTAHAENPDIFCTADFSRFLHRLGERYDHIIINAPAVLSSVDARILAQHADQVVYAVRWSQTPLDLIRAGQQVLYDVQAPITGLVMTLADMKNQRRASRHWSPSSKRFAQS